MAIGGTAGALLGDRIYRRYGGGDSRFGFDLLVGAIFGGIGGLMGYALSGPKE